MLEGKILASGQKDLIRTVICRTFDREKIRHEVKIYEYKSKILAA